MGPQAGSCEQQEYCMVAPSSSYTAVHHAGRYDALDVGGGKVPWDACELPSRLLRKCRLQPVWDQTGKTKVSQECTESHRWHLPSTPPESRGFLFHKRGQIGSSK
jgi:hypothetical protein